MKLVNTLCSLFGLCCSVSLCQHSSGIYPTKEVYVQVSTDNHAAKYWNLLFAGTLLPSTLLFCSLSLCPLVHDLSVFFQDVWQYLYLRHICTAHLSAKDFAQCSTRNFSEIWLSLHLPLLMSGPAGPELTVVWLKTCASVALLKSE